MKRVAIVQSNYIPWKGYFDIIGSVDEFILYDDMQYTRRDWRNRNQIKTLQGVRWLTVPVQAKGRYHQTIRETKIDGTSWAESHWRTLKQHYRRAAHFEEVAPLIEPLFLQHRYTHLAVLNRTLIEAICAILGITTKISDVSEYQLAGGKTERLAELCAKSGATEYVSGPTARRYIDEAVFAARGIDLCWFDYSGYPPYPQLWGEFVHGVTMLDLLFNCGGKAPAYMKYPSR